MSFRRFPGFRFHPVQPSRFRSRARSHSLAGKLTTASLLAVSVLPHALHAYPAAARQDQKASPAPQEAGGTAQPKPATIAFDQNLLTVRADDTDLVQILHALEQQTGMRIEGPIASTRVFGTFGPASPSAVITELLKGTGYNFVMTGVSTNGTPARLVLTARDGAATPPAPVNVASTTVPRPQSAPPPPQRASEFGPGAIEHVPPAPPEDAQTRAQQNMQRLQKMRMAQTTPTPNP